MAAHTISFTANANQEAILAKFLAFTNESRVAAGEVPYADIEEYFTFIMTEAFKGFVRQQAERDKSAVANAYGTATSTVQDQVESALGLNL